MIMKKQPRSRKRIVFSEEDKLSIKEQLNKGEKISEIARSLDKPYGSVMKEINTFGGKQYYSPAQSERVKEGVQRINSGMVKALAEDIKEVNEMLIQLFHFLEISPSSSPCGDDDGV
jgi:IS30 family transposase